MIAKSSMSMRKNNKCFENGIKSLHFHVYLSGFKEGVNDRKTENVCKRNTGQWQTRNKDNRKEESET